LKKSKFDIQGMTCSSCSSHVEKAVNKLDGVQNVSVNLLSNNMVAEFDETIVSDEDIIKSVVNAGYGANISEDTKKVTPKEKKTDTIGDTIKSMKKRLIISVCFLVPLMYIAMHHMFYEWFGLPVPQFIKDLFHGSENRNYIWIYTIFIITSNFICK